MEVTINRELYGTGARFYYVTLAKDDFYTWFRSPPPITIIKTKQVPIAVVDRGITDRFRYKTQCGTYMYTLEKNAL